MVFGESNQTELKSLKSEIRKILIEQARELGFDTTEESVALNYPPQPKFGDYSTNMAFGLVRDSKDSSSPDQVASQVAIKINELLTTFDSVVDRVEAKSGFINIFLKKQRVLNNLKNQVFSSKEKYGSSHIGRERRIIVEHTAVNPNKELHVGHLRNAAIGDVLSRVLRRAGCQVEVQNLVNDLGVQVVTTLLGFKELDLKQGPEERFDAFASRVYSEITKKIDQDSDLLEKRKRLHRLTDRAEGKEFIQLKEFVHRILAFQLQDLASLRIYYDLLVSESSTMEFRLWERAFSELKGTDRFVKERQGPNQGTWVIKSKSDNPREDKILVKSDGTVTYTGKDVAYHLWKFGLIDFDFLYKKWPMQFGCHTSYYTDRKGNKIEHLEGPTEIVNVIASEQDYPQRVVRDALADLGFNRAAEHYRHLSYEFVALSAKTARSLGVDTSNGRQVYHMSGRKGIGISFQELFQKMLEVIEEAEFKKTAQRSSAKAAEPKEIAVAAIRYYLTKFNYSTMILFDFDEALSLEGDTGPYLQYSHARAVGILEKAKFDLFSSFDLNRDQAISEPEWQLLILILRFPEIIEDVSLSYDVTQLTNYANQLATAFNYFYEKSPVLRAESKELRQQRLLIAALFKQTMANVLDTLGIFAPEAM